MDTCHVFVWFQYLLIYRFSSPVSVLFTLSHSSRTRRRALKIKMLTLVAALVSPLRRLVSACLVPILLVWAERLDQAEDRRSLPRLMPR